MPRSLLLPPNFQELDFFSQFTDAIDAVWNDNIDNPQVVFSLLRNTYSLAYNPWGGTNPTSGLFDINDFFTFSSPPVTSVQELITTLTPPAAIINTGEVKTGYSLNNTHNNLVIVYVDTTGTGNNYQVLPIANYIAISDTQIQFNIVLNQGWLIKLVQRQPSTELTQQLRMLGFQYQDTNFVNQSSYVESANVLQLLMSNYGTYLIETKGTRNFMNFFGFCFSVVFSIEQLWDSSPRPVPQPYPLNLNSTKRVPYNNLTPAGDPSIGTPIWLGGDWYPTPLANLYYDLTHYGNNIDVSALKRFFSYVANLNIVLNEVILTSTINTSANSLANLNIAIGSETIIIIE